MAATRRAEVIWEGNLMQGKGTVSAVSSGMFKAQPVTWASRVEKADGRTSPEELLAAAHASCFAMALSGGLAKAGTPARKLEVSAEVVFDKEGEGFAVKSSTLTVKGYGVGLDEVAFTMAAQLAKDGCPVSKALKGNVVLAVRAEYAGP